MVINELCSLVKERVEGRGERGKFENLLKGAVRRFLLQKRGVSYRNEG